MEGKDTFGRVESSRSLPGASTIPNTGLAPLMLVCTAFGIPASDVALLLPLDWAIDRYRTAINVLGDATGAALLQAALLPCPGRRVAPVQPPKAEQLQFPKEPDSSSV